MPGRLFERVDSLSRGVDRFLDTFLFRSVGVDYDQMQLLLNRGGEQQLLTDKRRRRHECD